MRGSELNPVAHPVFVGDSRVGRGWTSLTRKVMVKDYSSLKRSRQIAFFAKWISRRISQFRRYPPARTYLHQYQSD